MMRMLMKIATALLLLCAALTPASARPLENERHAGLVGDQADGYLGIVSGGTPALAQQVSAINNERRAMYAKIAAEKATSVDAVGAIFGEQLYQQAPSGEFFRGANGAWAKKP